MLSIILFVIIGIFFILLLGAFIIVPFKMAASKPFECPTCENKLKLITKTAKCPHCKTKLYKHVSGEYRVSV
ncbi:DUF2614 family zinc ribbon-containing protein [Psychrobacillus sp. FSL K6-2365]|uniref:DUF2614 family zinc ribbon-containing protein n=1 Tax=Psychrobacillus sp. FSL K6-2365 TaxID=2921546 RepID=UPI004046E266